MDDRRATPRFRMQFRAAVSDSLKTVPCRVCRRFTEAITHEHRIREKFVPRQRFGFEIWNGESVGMGGGTMSNPEEAKIPRVGTTTKAGAYLEGSAPLAWTATKPTSPGLYWYRKSLGSKAYIVDVELLDDTLRVDNKNTDQ